MLQRDLQGQLERQVQERTAELRASEERFRLLVEGTQDYAIFLLDPEGRVVSWNPGAERIKGYRADEIIGQHFSRFYPPEAVERGWPDQEVAAGGGRRPVSRTRAGGSARTGRVLGQRHHHGLARRGREAAGLLQDHQGLDRDGSEPRKRSGRPTPNWQPTGRGTGRRLCMSSGRWLRVTLDSIGDAVITTDTAGRVTFLNPVAEALTGWGQEQAQGQPLEAVFPILHEQTRRPVENPVAKVIREGVIVGLGNHTVLHRQGRDRKAH